VTESTNQKTGIPPNVDAACLKRSCLTLAPLSAHLVFWLVFAVGVTLDLWSKKTVFGWLDRAPRNTVAIVDGFLRLTAAENPGAAFGIATGRRNLLIAVSVAALIVVLVVFLLSGSERRLIHFSLGLFAAGVCGNLYDRLFNNGLVRDFIDVVYWPGRHWPAFNIADSLLCVAVGLLLLSNALTRKPA
jgi:signal peptidase II